MQVERNVSKCFACSTMKYFTVKILGWLTSPASEKRKRHYSLILNTAKIAAVQKLLRMSHCFACPNWSSHFSENSAALPVSQYHRSFILKHILY